MAIVPTSSSGSYRDDEEERDRGARAVFGAIRERETDARVRLPDDVMADPDAAARARKAARFTGTSAIAIERNMAEFDQRQRISSVDSAMRESERMRRWFVKDGAARVSHDDVPALREVADSYDRASSTGWLPWFGDQLSYLFTTRIGVDVGAGQVSVASDAAQRRATGATGGNNDVFARMGTFSADAQANEGFWDRIGSLLERGNAAVEEGFLNAIAQTTGSPRARRAAQQINQGVVTQQIAGATTWNDVKANPYNPATIGGYVLDAGVESLPYMATAAVPYAGVALVGTSMTGNIAAERAVNDGGTRGDANVWDFINAAPYGFTSAVLERLGIEAIFAGAGRSAARRIAGAAAGEAVTEFAQGNIEYAGETLGTATEFDWRQSLERGFAGALAGGPFGGTLRSGVEIANVAGGRFVQYSQARATEQVLGEIFTGAAKSKLRLRDPELFAEFMATQTAGTAAENLYVNGDTLRSLFQDEAGNPIDPPGEVNWQEMLPDFWDQLAQTDRTGGDVVIPMARAAAYLAGTPEWEIIKGASRVAPGGLSPNEARALEDDWSGMVEELGRRAYDEARADVEAEGPRTRVYNEVLSQARQAGFSLNASRAYADLWSERYQARAERLGGGTNAWQLFQESVAGIRQSLPGTVETYRRGDGIDVLINAMRRSAQDMQPEGEDLISRIMRGGGVVDAGGDIRSMGGGRVRRGGIFGRPLQTLIAEPDASGNFDSNLELDTWALNLWEEGYFGTREERPDINELLDLIGAALRGETIVPQGSNSAAVEANNAIVAAADDLRRILEDAGLDPETASRAEIDAALAAYQASEEGVRGFDQFAGPQSETADLHALQTARDMLAQGRSAELVRRETGWFRGPDGRWRYEISDEDARINEELVPDLGGAEPSWSDSSSSAAPAPSRDPVMLGDLLTHDRLYAAYPDLKMIEVAFLDEGTAQGSIDAGGMRMTLNPRRHSDLEELRVTLIHEVQHLIQRREGFARGGSPRMAEAVREAMGKFASSMHGNAAWTRLRNRALMDEAEQAKTLLGAVYMYETHEQLMRIVASDRPSRQLRHIRGASNWIYSDKIRKHADPEIQQRALDMSRAFYLMPKRHRTRERNEWLRNYAFDLAALIRDAMPDGTFQQFRDDPRQLRSVVKALEREARKLNERLEPVRVAERGAADALRISNVYRYKTDFEIYQGLAGEAEARNTQLRINLTEAERRDTPPDRTADVDLNDVIVVFQDGEISSPFIANVDAGGSSRSLFQSAWHGSPFTFDRFSTDFMGRGEGAQRFGWGLYFTSARAIGEHYREMLSSGSGTFTIADTGDTFDPSELRHLNARVIARRNGMDLAATMRQVRALMDGANDTMREMLEEDLARLAEIEERGGLRPPGEGRLYQVEIPDDDEFMVWEAPLSEQPERVRAAIAELQDQGAFGDLGDGYVVSVNDTATGEQIYRQLEAEQGDARAASEMLLAAGIAGNKYQAGQLSDRTPGDASNFVVFDAGRIEIRSMFQRGMPTLKAAVRHKGKVYSSVGDHLAAIAQIPDPDERAAAMRDGDNRGFVTERGRFLDRFRAQEYAVANGLISPDAPTWAHTSPELISENLMRYDEQLERGALSQEGARGRIDFLADNRAMITLFEGRDLSTLLHEGGHLWLEELRADARSGRAAGVTRDWETVKAWMTRETGLEIADGAPIPTEAHELWARAMERYFMEGRAPSAALRSAFASFRAWLVRIYKRVTGLNANLDDEVRKVMDRMIATDEAISFAQREGGDRALFTEAAAAGMTEAEFKAYQDLVSESRTEAYDKLLRKTMERVRIERTREYKDRRAETRIEVEREIRARPEWQAMDLLLGNGGVHTPVSRIGVIERVGRDAIAMLPRGRPGFPAITDQGLDPDLVAERVGFATGHEMLTALMGIGLRRAQLLEAGDKRSVLEEAIDVETDRRMTERYGDILQDGSIEEEALEIIHTNAGSARLAAEVRQLAQRAGETPTPEDAIRSWAERIVGEARIVDQASGAAVDRHRRAMEKAGRAAEQAYLNGDFAEAFRQKQRQQISNALFIASRNARDRVEVIGRKLDRYARSRGYKGMAPEYLDRIHELLEQFDLRRRTEATLREREAFDKWAARQRDMGIDVQVPERLTLAGDKHFTRMTYDEVIALDDAVESLANLGRQKMRLKMDKEERDLEEMVGQAVQNAVGLPSLAFDADRNRSRNLPRELNASLVKMEFIADYLDDRDPNGVFNEMLVKGATRAANRLEELQRDVLDPLAKLYLDMPAKERRRFAERIAVPEFISVDPETAERKPTVFLRSELIAVALNIGNKSNLEKMLQGETSAIAAILGEREAARYAWTEEKVMAVLSRHLSESDWQFVETVWERVNSLWPAIVETERELTGITPEKVEGRPVNTPFGTIEGGYYPLVYDPARSQMAANNADQEAADIFGSIGRFVGTPKGHTISRTSAAMPISFSLERVLFSHVKKVSTRIAYGRYVRDVMKFSGHPKIRKLFEDHLGLEYHAQIKPWLKEQIQDASMDLKHLAAIDRILRQFRVNMTLVGLGFRFTTMFAQIAGWHNAQAEIGTRWLARGVREMARNAGSIRSFVFEKSPELAGRAQAFDRDVRLFYQQAGEGTRLSGEGVFAKAARAADAAGIRKVQGAAFWGIGMIDVYLVAMPTWLGAFHKALEERGMSEAEAIAFADKAVRKSQSASRPKDLAAVQRGPEGIRVLTTFYSYFNVLYNKQFETASLVRRGNEAGRRGDKATKYEHWRQAAMNVWWIMLLAPVTSALLTGDIPEEEERDLEGWTAWALNRIFFGLWAGVPGIRDVATQAMRKIEGKFVGDIQSPFFTAFDAGGRSVEDLISVLQGDQPSERWIKNAIVAPGYFLGLPTGQLGTSVQYLADVAEGDQQPEDAGDVMKGIVKGPQQDQ